MWYVQGVERMREDLDLLHTPHLVFEWYLDAFPHVFRNSKLRYAPLESISPETALFLIIEEQFGSRPVFVDFSTRYSVPLANYDLRQHGVIYEVMRKGPARDLAPNQDAWNRYAFRGIAGEMFFRDLDTGKAILIYGNGYLEAGESLLTMGRRDEALSAFRAAAKISPELAAQANQVLAAYGLRL
jgi:tetratricopeptide (TPR) repeat protein